ncbi:MAG: hypothetical protein D6682_02390 [Zetaproteobacteria bacterium]|nr:MAG: hypothetical protein D6682_02390 [Zetaproteobacteria bacterium]
MLLAGVLGDDVARAVVERIGGGMVRIPVARRERVRRAVEMVTAGAPIRRTCRELGVDDHVVRARLRRRSEAR